MNYLEIQACDVEFLIHNVSEYDFIWMRSLQSQHEVIRVNFIKYVLLKRGNLETASHREYLSEHEDEEIPAQRNLWQADFHEEAI